MNWMKTSYTKPLAPWAFKLVVSSNSVTKATALWLQHPQLVCDMTLKIHLSSWSPLLNFGTYLVGLGIVAYLPNRCTKHKVICNWQLKYCWKMIIRVCTDPDNKYHPGNMQYCNARLKMHFGMDANPKEVSIPPSQYYSYQGKMVAWECV